MDNVLSVKRQVKSCDTDRFRRMRLSVLFRILQELSIAHTEALGAGRAKTLDKGALWVMGKMKVEMSRPIFYDEKILLESWPGKTVHFIFPRYYQFINEDGELLCNASGIWALIDQETRRVVMPEELGISLPEEKRDNELSLPMTVKVQETAKTYERKVTYSDIDLNGHVNNTCYLDWFEDLFPMEYHKSHYWKRVQIHFIKEIYPNQKVEMKVGNQGDTWYMEGFADGETVFRLSADSERID